MMGPLSAYYFGSMSLSAPLANFIAIPLIGVIVQLGMIAGIIGAFIPVIGMHLALLINAANWLGVKFFLGMAHVFAILIPFPRISQPGFGEVLLYYALLHLVVFWHPITSYVRALFAATTDLLEDEETRMPMTVVTGVFIALVLFAGGFMFSRIEKRVDLRLTVFDVGFGASTLVEAGSRRILIDTGLSDSLSGYDAAERVLLPAFSTKGIRRLDAVILTSCLPERISGLDRLLEDCRVDAIYAPFPIPTDGKPCLFPQFVASFTFADMKVEDDFKKGFLSTTPPNFYWELALSSWNALVREVQARKIPVHRLGRGTTIPGWEKTITVTGPDHARERFSAYYGGATLLIGDGRRTIGLTGTSAHSWKETLGETSLDLLVASDLPFPTEKMEEFVRDRRPERMMISFRKPSRWLMDKYYLEKMIDGRAIQSARKLQGLSLEVWRSDQHGALQVDLDRGTFQARVFVPGRSTGEAGR